MRKSLWLAAIASLLTMSHPARAQFCPGVTPWVFDDVAASDPFCGYITWMAENFVSSGCQIIDANHRLFCPNANVTRTQMAAFMNRLGNIRVEAVDTGPGLLGGPITGIGTITLAPTQLLPTTACGSNQIPRWNGSAWACGNDANSGGTVTSVGSGGGLTGGPITASGTLSIATGYQLPQGCANGQVAKSNGSGAWSCSADNDSGGTVTQVNTGTGLTGGPITTTGTVSIATGGVGNPQLADGSVNVAKLDTASTDQRYYKQSGNAFGATAVLGTTDNNALDIRTNGTRVMRFEPNAISPNVIGGHPANNVTAGVRGATIAGGGVMTGDTDPIFTGEAPNRVTDVYGTVGGGYGNRAGNDVFSVTDQPFATVGGGYLNIAQSGYSTVAGGTGNLVNGVAGAIAGGDGNTAGASSFIGGGTGNQASLWSVVAGGLHNEASGVRSIAAGGENNEASGSDSTVSGGLNNHARGTYGTVAGGVSNFASSAGTEAAATVGGGSGNTVNGNYSTVTGGRLNVILADYAWAGGHNARVNTGHNGAFVWADDNGSMFHSVAANEFAARSAGGVRFVTAVNGSGVPTAGVSLAAGDSAWSVISDRNAKENWVDVDARDVLARVGTLPIGAWNYKAQGSHVRHIGPAAQDFHAAFGLGHSDRSITTVDADGVALAAIKGAHARLEEHAATIRTQARELEELRAEIRAMRELLASATRQ